MRDIVRTLIIWRLIAWSSVFGFEIFGIKDTASADWQYGINRKENSMRFYGWRVFLGDLRTGIVVSVDYEKGEWGFVQDSETGEDIFFHMRQKSVLIPDMLEEIPYLVTENDIYKSGCVPSIGTHLHFAIDLCDDGLYAPAWVESSQRLQEIQRMEQQREVLRYLDDFVEDITYPEIPAIPAQPIPHLINLQEYRPTVPIIAAQ